MLPNYRFGGPKVNIHGKLLKEFNLGAKVTCTSANAVYDVGDILASVGGSTIVDGTNVLAHTELILTLNDFTQPTTSAASVKVSLFRTNSNDGTATSSLSTADKVIIDNFGMDAQSVVRIPAISTWGVKKFKIASTSAGAVIQVTIKGVYYTP